MNQTELHIFTGREPADMMKKYLKIIRLENDRGAIIVAAALVEEDLSDLLKKKLVEPIKKKQDFLFNGSMALLGTFAAKTEMAFRLGLIRREIKSMFDELRKLRNKCAHRVDVQDEVYADSMLKLIEMDECIYQSVLAVYGDTPDLQELGVTKENMLERIGIRAMFDTVFVHHIIGIQRVHLDVEKTVELI